MLPVGPHPCARRHASRSLSSRASASARAGPPLQPPLHSKGLAELRGDNDRPCSKQAAVHRLVGRALHPTPTASACAVRAPWQGLHGARAGPCQPLGATHVPAPSPAKKAAALSRFCGTAAHAKRQDWSTERAVIWLCCSTACWARPKRAAQPAHQVGLPVGLPAPLRPVEGLGLGHQRVNHSHHGRVGCFPPAAFSPCGCN